MKRMRFLCVALPVLVPPLVWIHAIAQAPAAVAPAVDVDAVFAKWTTATPGCAVGARLGTIVFRRNGAGQVHELSVVQDRVWDLRFARQPSGRGSL